jgi:hypothetical protein
MNIVNERWPSSVSRAIGLVNTMAAKVLQFIPGPDQRDFGGCPKCHGNNGCLTDRSGDHYFICRRHRLKWKFGSRLFPAWEKMSFGSLIRQGTVLALYRETTPWFADVTITNDSGIIIEFTNPTKPMYRWATHAAVSLEDRCKLVTQPNDPIFARAWR